MSGPELMPCSAAPVRARPEIEGVISGQASNPGARLIVMGDVFNVGNSNLIISLAARYRVPAVCFNAAQFARSGGLITYSDDYIEECRLTAGYIERILKGGQTR